MWTALGEVIGGGLLLYFGAEWLVKGAAGIARAFGVPALVVGLTVVAYGTSAPELTVAVAAAAQGRGAIVLGNSIGSNLANLGLVLGVTALIAPPRLAAGLARRELPALLGSVAALPLVLRDGVISRLEGALLLLGALGFTAATLRAARRDPATARDAAGAVAVAEASPPALSREAQATTGRGALAMLALVGLAGLVLGGRLFVEGAVDIARRLGMSDRVVGLTVVAVGTSMPELAASVVAALRGQPEIAVGNVIGSNVFNVLLILGAAALVHPVQAPAAGLWFDLAALGVLSLLASFVMRTARTLTRAEGLLLAAGYAGFLALVARGGG